MKLFRKKVSKQDEKVLAEASKLAVDRLEQYITERRISQTAATDGLQALKKSVTSLTRLRWW
jgi:hypothetical protein